MAENSANPEQVANDANPVQEPIAPGKTMKSVILLRFGDVKQMLVKEMPEVKPREGEVLIRVKSW